MKRFIFFVLLASLAFSACSGTPETPSAQEIQTAIAQTQGASPTHSARTLPTSTTPVKPPPTPIPTSTPEPVVIATIIADPKSNFNYAQVFGVAHLDNGYFLVTIAVPGIVEGNYRATLGEEAFVCMVLADYPDRLYCSGITEQTGQIVPFQIFSVVPEEVVFETELGIPQRPLTELQQAKLEKEDRNESTEPPPADVIPPYPYP